MLLHDLLPLMVCNRWINARPRRTKGPLLHRGVRVPGETGHF